MATQEIWLKRSVILTPILLLIAIFFIGGGHGWYEPAIVLFPWGSINIMWQSIIGTPFMLLALVQYLVYGFLLDRAASRNRLNIMAWTIALIHIVLSIVILLNLSPNFKHT